MRLKLAEEGLPVVDVQPVRPALQLALYVGLQLRQLVRSLALEHLLNVVRNSLVDALSPLGGKLVLGPE